MQVLTDTTKFDTLNIQIILNELTLRIYLMRKEKFCLHREESRHPSMDPLA